MKKPHAPTVRAYLRQHLEGVTINELIQNVESLSHVNDHTLRNVLGSMPDVYIDRWADPKRGQYQAVWSIVIPPADCPYPTDRNRPESRWIDKHSAYVKGITYAQGRMLNDAHSE